MSEAKAATGAACSPRGGVGSRRDLGRQVRGMGAPGRLGRCNTTCGFDQGHGCRPADRSPASERGRAAGGWPRAGGGRLACGANLEKPKEEGRHPDAALGVRLRGTCPPGPRLPLGSPACPRGGSFLLRACTPFHRLSPPVIPRGRLLPPYKSSGGSSRQGALRWVLQLLPTCVGTTARAGPAALAFLRRRRATSVPSRLTSSHPNCCGRMAPLAQDASPPAAFPAAPWVPGSPGPWRTEILAQPRGLWRHQLELCPERMNCDTRR